MSWNYPVLGTRTKKMKKPLQPFKLWTFNWIKTLHHSLSLMWGKLYSRLYNQENRGCLFPQLMVYDYIFSRWGIGHKCISFFTVLCSRNPSHTNPGVWDSLIPLNFQSQTEGLHSPQSSHKAEQVKKTKGYCPHPVPYSGSKAIPWRQGDSFIGSAQKGKQAVSTESL